MGSLTMGGAVQSPWTFRSVSIPTILIILLWSLSPLGSQATSHCAFIQQNYLTNGSTITHCQTDIRALMGSVFAGTDSFTPSLQSTDAWLQYANTSDNSSAANSFVDLISQLGGHHNSGLLSAADIWGNVRIPKLESLPEYTIDEPEKWLEVPWADMVVNYTSLIGIPFSALDLSMVSSDIQMRTAYFDLSVSQNLITTICLYSRQ